MEENKTQGEILREKLFHKKENGWEHTSEERKMKFMLIVMDIWTL